MALEEQTVVSYGEAVEPAKLGLSACRRGGLVRNLAGTRGYQADVRVVPT